MKWVIASSFMTLNFFSFKAPATSSLLLGCLDCFNFVAPSVIAAENINPPEAGLIVYDTTQNKFRGYTATGAWATLSEFTAPATSVVTKTSNYTLLNTDDTVVANTSSGGFTLALPDAATVQGKIYHLVFPSIEYATIVDPYSVQTICGQSTITVPGKDAIDIQSDGANWIGLGDACTLRWHMGNATGAYCNLGNAQHSGPRTVATWGGPGSTWQRCDATMKTGICSSTIICTASGNQDGTFGVPTYNGSTTTISFRGPGTDVAFSAGCSCDR